jgi:hypothetical protein
MMRVSQPGRLPPRAFSAPSACEPAIAPCGVTPVTTLTHVLGLVRRVRIPLYAAGVLSAVMATYPGGVGAAYQNASEISKLNAEMEQLHHDRARMEQECVLVANRIAVKEELVEELIVGRKSLQEVSTEFARLHSDEPVQALVLQHMYPGASELEYNARTVLGYAEQRCGSDSMKERVMENLNCQFREMMDESRD